MPEPIEPATESDFQRRARARRWNRLYRRVVGFHLHPRQELTRRQLHALNAGRQLRALTALLRRLEPYVLETMPLEQGVLAVLVMEAMEEALLWEAARLEEHRPPETGAAPEV